MSLYKSMIISVFALVLFPLGALAEGESRQVTVTGRAEVRVVPDEVVLSFGVETMNLELNLAKEENDRIVTAALEAIKELGLNADQAKTDYMRIEPVYSNMRSSAKTLLGYQVSNSLVVTSQEIVQVEDLLSSLLEAGVNRVIGVEFRSTEFRQHRDKALLMALDAAKEKAGAMAGHLGSKIGKPLSIKEGAPSIRPSASNVSMREFSGGGWLDGPLAPGEVSIPAVATVVFELVD